MGTKSKQERTTCLKYIATPKYVLKYREAPEKLDICLHQEHTMIFCLQHDYNSIGFLIIITRTIEMNQYFILLGGKTGPDSVFSDIDLYCFVFYAL